MTDEGSFWHWLATGALALVVTILGFFGARTLSNYDERHSDHDKGLADHEKDIANTRLALTDFKTHVATNHPDKASIAAEITSLRQENRESNQRIHERMDAINSALQSLPKELLTMIKDIK